MKTLIFTTLLCLVFVGAIAQEAGTLDVAFNKTGIKIFSIESNVGSAALATTAQLDGKLLVGGVHSVGGDVEAYVVRLHPDGTFDSTFHFDGKVTIDMSNEDLDELQDMIARPDGKILTVGATKKGGDYDVQVFQLMPDGALDPNFGALGVSQLDIDPLMNDRAEGMRLASDGSCFIIGTSTGNNQQYSWVIKLTPQGQPDQSFGTNGRFILDENDPVVVKDLVVLPDNRVILGADYFGANSATIGLVGLTTNGTLDVGFGNGGVALHPLSSAQADLIMGLAITPDQSKLMVIGMTDDNSVDILLARFSISGGKDLSFGNNGYLKVDLSIGADDLVTSGLVQGDGKILVQGTIGDEMYVARFQEDGQLDVGFNSTGYWRYNLNPGDEDTPTALNLDRYGRIISVGYFQKAGLFLSFCLAHHVGSAPTGMDRLTPTALRAYPNPTEGLFTVELPAFTGSANCQVLDMKGRVVFSTAVTAAVDRLQIDASAWASGIYTLVIAQEGARWQAKVLRP